MTLLSGAVHHSSKLGQCSVLLGLCCGEEAVGIPVGQSCRAMSDGVPAPQEVEEG